MSRPFCRAPLALLLGNCRKFFEVYRVGALRFQIFPEEIRVAEFVIGIIVNILRHIAIKVHKSANVRLAAASTEFRPLAVLDSAEFVVLHPQITFY